MKNIYFYILLPVFLLHQTDSRATDLSLQGAINNTYTACGQIFTNIYDAYSKQQLSVALGAIGTGLSAGGTIAGGIGLAQNKEHDKLREELSDTHKQVKTLKSEETTYTKPVDNSQEIQNLNTQKKELKRELKDISDSVHTSTTTSFGLLVPAFFANTIATILGATNANIEKELATNMQNCIDAVSIIPAAQVQYKLETGADNSDTLYVKSQNIINTCGQYDVSKLQKIKQYSVAGTIANAVSAAGALTGGSLMMAGAADNKNNMMTAGTAIGGVSTAASATGVALNAAQLQLVKELSEITEQCADALEYKFSE